jgi:HlyD family secretion protein
VLADVNAFFLDVGVDEVDVARVAEGQAVTVTLDALPNALLTGKVEKIALLATNNASGVVSYSVRVLLDPAEIAVAEARDVVLVPNWAIRRDRESGLTYVGILRNGVLGEVEVKLGLHNETYSEVTSGLAENDVVAVDTTREQIRLLGGGQ